ncbi:hypothetical protein D3C72_2418830 [compost metagenome]
MGARTHAGTSGAMIGPPADKAYAVEPVGVARIMPSVPYVATRDSPAKTSNSSIRDEVPFRTTPSFNAVCRASVSPSR